MVHRQKILGIICARGGSKSIPHKNIYPLNKKPLLWYTIKEAQKSKYIDRLIISTDDQKIAKTAKKYGVEVPFLRPIKLATDTIPTLPVLQHALKWLATNDQYRPNIIVILEPTAPFRKAEHIDKAVLLLAKNLRADSIRGVCVPFQNPFKMWVIKNGYLKPLIKFKGKETCSMPRQALPKAYWQNGYIFIARYDTIMKQNSLTGKNVLPYIMDEKDYIDIDDMFTLQIAEFLLKYQND